MTRPERQTTLKRAALDLTKSFDINGIAAMQRDLLRWYRQHGRRLPWRMSGDPYRIWVSEIMLQQTTVAAVVPYFERFLTRFPTVHELAAAHEQDVLRLWEGLGYYSRGRNLHAAARQLVAQSAGQKLFPQTVADWRELPGIGRYTAGAIVSFAFDQPAPIVEANTLRVYCRLAGYAESPQSTRGQNFLWDFATGLLPRGRKSSPGDWNQALMDLGATVCRAKAPLCEECPVKTHCVAFATGRQNELPVPKPAKVITETREICVAISSPRGWLLRQRKPGERWAGLWDFCRIPMTAAEQHAFGQNSHSTPQWIDHLEQRIQDETRIKIQHSNFVKSLRHNVTRYRIDLDCYRAELAGRLPRGSEYRVIPQHKLPDTPLSVTGRQFAKLLTNDER